MELFYICGPVQNIRNRVTKSRPMTCVPTFGHSLLVYAGRTVHMLVSRQDVWLPVWYDITGTIEHVFVLLS